MNIDRALQRACVSAFIQLNTPISLSSKMLLEAGEWDQLAQRQISPSNYLDTPSGASRYSRDVQAVDLLRKAPLPTTFDRREAAESIFRQAEEQCCRSNLNLSLARDYPLGELEYAMHQIMQRGKKWITRVFGVLPKDLSCGFGPGTTYELKGSTTSAIGDKITMAQATTQSAQALSAWAWDRSLPARVRIESGLPLRQVVPGNRFVVVPKDGKTDRGICVEPGGNLYLQKGIGSYLKERLGAVGLYVWKQPRADLSDPTQWTPDRPMAEKIHRTLAREGSRYGEWCTIDLSNASDTVCRELVKWLIPDDWYSLMEDVRSKKTLFPRDFVGPLKKGETRKRIWDWHVLHKFSSMGNGFTFELETAIFAAIVHGVTGLTPGRDFFVFGDDIVVPTRYSKDVLAALKCFGFTPNPKKSFDAGPFRESCGGDFFIGYDVRPYQIKTLGTSIIELKALHNGLVGKRLYRAARCVLDSMPTVHRTFGPCHYGDAVLHGHVSRWKVTKKNGCEWIRPLMPFYTAIPLDRWGDEKIVISQMLLGLKATGYVPRDSEPDGWRRGWLSVS